MIFVKDIFKDEIRDGFLVTTDKKKAWNKMLELLAEIDRICRKHSIRYFAENGTLLGAARHKGFIPWDDDIDIMMLRPDYEKFKQIAPKEIKETYDLLTAYTNDSMLITIAKLMDLKTAAIENIAYKHQQGIFVDIWPFDDIPDGSERNQKIWDIRQTLIDSIMTPNELLKKMEKGFQCKPSNDFVREFLKLSSVERFREYEIFCTNHFGESENVGYPFSKIMGIKGNLKREYYREVVYLDFENVKIPAPVDYERVLEAEYGDWHKFVRARSFHEVEYMSVDVSYKRIQNEVDHGLKEVEKVD